MIFIYDNTKVIKITLVLNITLLKMNTNSVNFPESGSDNGDDHYDDELVQEQEKIIHAVCETEECSEIFGVDLKELCDIEGDKVFDRVKKFVEDNNSDTLKHDIQKLFTKCPDSATGYLGSTNDNDKINFENLIILKTFKRLKLIEKESSDYKAEYEKYDLYQNMYVNNSERANIIHNINTTSINELNQIEIDKIIETTLTPFKKHQELLKYELNFYEPKHKIHFTESNLKEIVSKICADINRFNPIIQDFLEDKRWTINIGDTLNFTIPNNRVVLSNTIATLDITNAILITHLDMILDYVKRVYKVTSTRYLIIEDNKFDISWVFITLGYSK